MYLHGKGAVEGLAFAARVIVAGPMAVGRLVCSKKGEHLRADEKRARNRCEPLKTTRIVAVHCSLSHFASRSNVLMPLSQLHRRSFPSDRPVHSTQARTTAQSHETHNKCSCASAVDRECSSTNIHHHLVCLAAQVGRVCYFGRKPFSSQLLPLLNVFRLFVECGEVSSGSGVWREKLRGSMKK